MNHKLCDAGEVPNQAVIDLDLQIVLREVGRYIAKDLHPASALSVTRKQGAKECDGTQDSGATDDDCCSHGKYSEGGGSPCADRPAGSSGCRKSVCKPCRAGSWSSATGNEVSFENETCILCVAGKYGDTQGSLRSDCMHCLWQGQYSLNEGASHKMECKECWNMVKRNWT